MLVRPDVIPRAVERPPAFEIFVPGKTLRRNDGDGGENTAHRKYHDIATSAIEPRPGVEPGNPHSGEPATAPDQIIPAGECRRADASAAGIRHRNPDTHQSSENRSGKRIYDHRASRMRGESLRE